jgi:hypothetical protein
MLRCPSPCGTALTPAASQTASEPSTNVMREDEASVSSCAEVLLYVLQNIQDVHKVYDQAQWHAAG